MHPVIGSGMTLLTNASASHKPCVAAGSNLAGNGDTRGGWLLAALGLASMLAPWNQLLASEPLLHPMFQKHAVLQRDAPIRMYGRSEANARVVVSMSGNRVEAVSNDQGRWQAELPAMPAGGPHVLEVGSGKIKQRVDDLLIGDVWLCSGQSNMVLQVHRSLDARAEIADSGNPRIRMLTVAETGSVSPLDQFATSVEWKLASSATAADFSAACFYFARELQKTVDVPMGLVVAAWGGSRIEAWTSAEALRARGDFRAELAALQAYATDPAAGSARWGEIWSDWWQHRRGVDAGDRPWRMDFVEDAQWSEAPRDLGAWERWGVAALADYNGMLWYRNSLRLTGDQARQSAVLELGAIDETDMTWVNGRAVGSLYGPGQPRAYVLPEGLLRAGDNQVVINVLDTYKAGGLDGPANANAIRLADGTRLPLEAPWHWRASPGNDWPPRAPWQTAAGLSTLYNGMIAPIGAYGFRGVVWYQGESNTGEAGKYDSLLTSLISDWRKRFRSDLPWLNVQLAGYGPAPTRPAESGWAELREVQRRHGAQDAHYGIATAVDIGDRYDIHPPNKQELGRRLARLARHLVFGETTLAATGPQPISARREDEEVVVSFADVTDGLVVYGATRPIGFELCSSEKIDPQQLQCQYANATVDQHAVRLQGEGMEWFTHVRHAWSDNPVITLFDGAGLPAQPFQMRISSQAGEAD